MRSGISRFWLRLALGGICLLFLFGAWLFGSDISEARRSLSWPSTTGTIVLSDLVLAYKSVTMYDVVVRYSYRVHGSVFESTRISASNRYKGDHEWARNFLAKNYPLGGRVTVYYDPADPAKAVLKPGQLAPGSAFMPWVMIAMAALCILGTVSSF